MNGADILAEVSLREFLRAAQRRCPRATRSSSWRGAAARSGSFPVEAGCGLAADNVLILQTYFL
jgi:hypothetical protein